MWRIEVGHNFNFDKFVTDICRREDDARERVKKFQDETEELPQRRYARLYRKDWRDSTRLGKKQ
ncbi:MAG: hypothetical protein CMB80_28275 [Flammeovirgaceae bacterium]|nr:hypothetical protein [Flammeovirgaceae bacterium]